jgi:transcriptional regulator with XRE-family HTH domain
MGVSVETVINWEKDRTKPVASQFRPLVDFLGYDPSPATATLADRVQAKRRQLGVTLEQVSGYLGWDPGSLKFVMQRCRPFLRV